MVVAAVVGSVCQAASVAHEKRLHNHSVINVDIMLFENIVPQSHRNVDIRTIVPPSQRNVDIWLFEIVV